MAARKREPAKGSKLKNIVWKRPSTTGKLVQARQQVGSLRRKLPRMPRKPARRKK